MAEQHITETRTVEGGTVTRHTIVEDRRSRGGARWLFLLLLLVAVVAAIVLFSRFGAAEAAKDAAVGDAAAEVGEAADQIGDAAQDVADTVTRS